MPLLELVTREALDGDYEAAARRRAAAPSASAEDPGEPPRRTSLRGAAVVTAVFGLMIALAAVQNSREADVQDASRSALIDRIEARRADVRDLETRLDTLEGQIGDLRGADTRVRNEVGDLTVQQRRLQLSTGFVDVEGPGVRYTIDDAADGDPDGRVRSGDLRLLVNALWRSGAEAIAVNGRRLTSLSAIVNQGIAVTVNRQPLTPPYVVSAIGDYRTLAADVLTTTTGEQFESLAEQFGFVVDRQNVEDGDGIQLTAASPTQLRLRWAESEATGRLDPPFAPREETP